MKILLLHLHDRQYQMGGADQGVLELACALQNQNDYEIRLLTNAGPFAEALQKKGVRVIQIPHEHFNFLKIVKIIDEQIKHFRPDVFHSHHRYLTFLLDVFFKDKKIPILHTQRVQTWDKRFLFRYGHFMTTVSESLRKHMVDYYHVPPNRIKAIVNAVSLEEPDPQSVNELRQKYFKQTNQWFGFCAGRFHPQKGHVYLIEAVGKLEVSYQKRLKIFLAGDGPLEEEFKRLIEKKKIQDVFIFTGYLKRISNYLELCDFLILPSLWEGLPRTILEAFSIGKPVIATDIPGTSDVVEHRYNGLKVEPRNPEDLAAAIRYLMDHPQELSRMHEGAKQSALKYSFKAMVQNYQNLYQELTHS